MSDILNNDSGFVVDIDGNKYKTVRIGSQLWIAENLNVSRFRNGDIIPEIMDDDEWERAGDNGRPAWCYYDNDPSNGRIYGKLYNWYAVTDPRGLAPEGWHIPSDEEWQELCDYLGGEDVAGGKIKERGTTHWKSPNEGATNESGFSGLPCGCRSSFGVFNDREINAYFWSGTEYYSYSAWFRFLDYSNSVLDRSNYYGKRCGFSVRILRD